MPYHPFLLYVFLVVSFFPSSLADTGSDTTATDRYGLYSNFDPSMAIVIMVLICVFFFVGLFSIVLRQCSDHPTIVVSANLGAERQGLDPTVRSSFPVFLYSEIRNRKLGVETLECAICLNEFSDDELLKLLPKCSHVFHQECIDTWLKCHVTCPVCRDMLNSPFHQPVTADESPAPPHEVAIPIDDGARREVRGKFPRSHSTGHSLVRDRFTLRISDEVRRQIMESAKLKRTRSFEVVLTGEGSSKGRLLFGWSDRVRNQPFGFRGSGSGSGSGSAKYNKGAEDGDSLNSRIVRVPLNCFEGPGR